MRDAGEELNRSVREGRIVVQIIVIETLFFIVGVTRADLKHFDKMPDAEKHLN